jgi:hypothetical protein
VKACCLILWSVLALVDQAPDQRPEAPAKTLMERLEPADRLRAFMALLAIVLLGVFSIWLIRMTGRVTRWYAAGAPERRYRPRPPAGPDVDDWVKKPLADEAPADPPPSDADGPRDRKG